MSLNFQLEIRTGLHERVIMLSRKIQTKKQGAAWPPFHFLTAEGYSSCCPALKAA